MDDYKLLKPLGHGSMGTVFLAEFRDTKTLFALKIMSKEALVKGKAVDRAATEKEILSRLQSPYLLSLQGHFETQKHQILVLDYCPGGDLSGLRQKQPGKKFSEAAARFYGAEIVLALDHLHKHGFVYRDLKPENVLIDSSGHLVLTDFDLCLKMFSENEETPKSEDWLNRKQCVPIFSCIGTKLHGEDVGPRSAALRFARFAIGKSCNHKLSSSKVRAMPLEAKKLGTSTERSRSFVGTDEYVAPEIIWGIGHDYAVDWWSFGVLLYELVHGTTPFKSFSRKGTLFNIVSKEPRLSDLSTDLNDLIRRLLMKEPSQRLGNERGADEIKSHAFFKGICWDAVKLVSRPPYVPSPILQGDIESIGSEAVDLEECMAEVERLRAGSKAMRGATKLQENSGPGDNLSR